MEEKSTGEVEKLLEKIKPEQLSGFYKDNRNSFVDDKKAFYYYVKDVLEAKNIYLKDVYIYAGVSENYGEKIVRMEKHTKSRDLILRLLIAGHLSLTQINKALKLYGMNCLYAKDRRDAAIIVAVNNRIYDLIIIDEMLKEEGFKPLLENED